MFTGFIKCNCSGVCIEVNPFICTTTTTTTLTCNRWQYAYDSFVCNTCSKRGGGSFFNSNPLTLGNYYNLNGIVILPYAFLGCSFGEPDANIENIGVPKCDDIICTTTTTTTILENRIVFNFNQGYYDAQESCLDNNISNVLYTSISFPFVFYTDSFLTNAYQGDFKIFKVISTIPDIGASNMQYVIGNNGESFPAETCS